MLPLACFGLEGCCSIHLSYGRANAGQQSTPDSAKPNASPPR